MGELRERHDREWFRPQFKVTFVWDYFDNDFPSHNVHYELLNVEGENAERGITKVKNSTQEERDAVKAMMEREIQAQLVDDGFIPYPRMTPIVPTEGQVLSGTVTIQIEVLSLTMGEFTVAFRVNSGNWLECTYNPATEYYERSVNTAGMDNGEHSFEIRAQDGLNVLLELDPFTVEVDN